MAPHQIDEDDIELCALGRLAEPDAAPVEEHLLVWPGAALGVGSVRRGDAGGAVGNGPQASANNSSGRSTVNRQIVQKGLGGCSTGTRRQIEVIPPLDSTFWPALTSRAN
jgi:hypothetical protein